MSSDRTAETLLHASNFIDEHARVLGMSKIGANKTQLTNTGHSNLPLEKLTLPMKYFLSGRCDAPMSLPLRLALSSETNSSMNAVGFRRKV